MRVHADGTLMPIGILTLQHHAAVDTIQHLPQEWTKSLSQPNLAASAVGFHYLCDGASDSSLRLMVYQNTSAVPPLRDRGVCSTRAQSFVFSPRPRCDSTAILYESALIGEHAREGSAGSRRTAA